MKDCIFPFYSRTASRLPGALFVGNRLHSMIQLTRTVAGYIAEIPPELAAYLESDVAQAQGVAIDDLDMPRAQPRLFRRETGWKLPRVEASGLDAVAHDLAVAARRPVELWATDSISVAFTTLLAMGYDLDALAQLVFITLLGRFAGPEDVERLSRALRRRSAHVSEMVFDVSNSPEFINRRHSLAEPYGMTVQRLLSIVRHYRRPGYAISGQYPAIPCLTDVTPTVAISGGWWKPVNDGAMTDYWSSYSVAIVVRPPEAGRWIFRAIRSEHDAGIRLRRWRVGGETGVSGELHEDEHAIALTFESPTGEAVFLEWQAEAFFIPSDAVPGEDHRSLALCFRAFSVSRSPAPDEHPRNLSED